MLFVVDCFPITAHPVVLCSLHNHATLFLTLLIHACVNFVVALFCQVKGTTAQPITAAAHTCVCRGRAASPAAALTLGTPHASRGTGTSESTRMIDTQVC